MGIPIIIFYHCCFEIEGEFLPNAIHIVSEQMDQFKQSGLLDAASEFHVGMNAGDEGAAFSGLFPEKATITYHGIKCRNELRTLLMLENRVKCLTGQAYYLWSHAKGCSHPSNDPMRTAWRQCFMRHIVSDWRKCVHDLDSGHDAVSCHWMTPPKTPPTQYIFAGNMWWCKSSFLGTLPSVMERARIKESGIDSLESRYEAEVILGNGPRIPIVKDYCPNWHPGKSHSA